MSLSEGGGTFIATAKLHQPQQGLSTHSLVEELALRC
jgi:hypothetical protein